MDRHPKVCKFWSKTKEGVKEILLVVLCMLLLHRVTKLENMLGKKLNRNINALDVKAAGKIQYKRYNTMFSEIETETKQTKRTKNVVISTVLHFPDYDR